MARKQAKVRRFRGGLRFESLGHGQRPLVVFDGLWLDDKPQRMTARMYKFLGDAYTVYVVARRQGMPHGYSLADMADDYAKMVTDEFQAPIDVVGVSTGGSIALHFAADHPNLVRRLVLHSGACRLNDEARRSQRESARLAGLGQWRAALAQLMSPALPQSGPFRVPAHLLVGLVARLMTVRPPNDASDFITTVEAEDALDFADRLGEITAPTLVVGGTKDRFYSPALFRQTAEGIPNGQLALYEGKHHAPTDRRFRVDMRTFLLEAPS